MIIIIDSPSIYNTNCAGLKNNSNCPNDFGTCFEDQIVVTLRPGEQQELVYKMLEHKIWNSYLVVYFAHFILYLGCSFRKLHSCVETTGYLLN